MRLQEWYQSEDYANFAKEMKWRHDREIRRNFQRQEELRRCFPWDWLSEIYLQYKRR